MEVYIQSMGRIKGNLCCTSLQLVVLGTPHGGRWVVQAFKLNQQFDVTEFCHANVSEIDYLQ